MSEFYLGFAFGSIIIGAIVTPFLTYFGMVYFNIRRMEKNLIRESKKEINSEPNDEIKNTVYDAEKLLREHKQNVVQS